MVLKILCFGRLDQKPVQDLFLFYAHKILKKVNFEVIELKEDFNAEKKVNLQNNSNLLKERLIKFSDYQIVLLDIQGTLVTSEEFAMILEENKNFKNGKLLFIIGPSDGYDDEFKHNYQRISFGPITFPHQLFRVVLAEQIYRALKIIDHEQYHK